MADVALFACCREPIGGGNVWLAPAGELPSVAHAGEATGEVVPLTRDHAAARHEAAHAAVQVACGGEVDLVTIDGPSFMRSSPGLTFPASVIVTLAGPACDAWSKSQIARVPDPELVMWAACIRALQGGGCDRCSAVRSTLLAVARRDGCPNFPPDLDVIAEFRRLENLAASIVMLPPIWSAIIEIAGRLSDAGTLIGDEVTEICRRHFAPGFISLKDES